MDSIQYILPMAVPAPAAKELKSYKAGEVTPFKQALSSPMVRTSPDEKIKEVLRYAMLLVGIRSENIPEGKEKQVLINFIRSQYAGHKLEEVRLAFEMAVAGQLEMGKDGAKCFENFSCEFVGRIMAAYRKWASSVSEEMQRQYEAPAPALPPANYNPLELVDMFYQEYLTGELNLDTIPARAYEVAIKNGMEIPQEEAVLIVTAARDYVVSQYQHRLKYMVFDSTVNSFQETKDKLSFLEKVTDAYDAVEDPFVNRYAKALALQKWFSVKKEQGITSLVPV